MSEPRPDRVERPDAALRAAVAALAARLEERDGAPPLSDQALARLAGTDDGAAVDHLVLRSSGRLIGYAQLDRRAEPATGEVAAEPEALDAAVAALVAAVGEAALLVWSHGTRSPLAGVLARHGFSPARRLHQLRRPLTESDALAAPPPDGVVVRSFVVGEDEPAWLAVNAAAFADHPEQGGWTLADLRARERESWFDPAGLLMAERDGELLGFHWTKVHPDGAGEVYVLAVAPAGQRTGLGRSLLRLGLAHLRRRGCPEVLLYVDESNTAAMRLYESAGFGRHNLDVQWRSGRPQGQSTGRVSNT